MEGGTKITNYKNIKGTLVGFYSPTFMRTVSVQGFHFHYLSDDLSSGGHIFDFSGKNLNIEFTKSPTISFTFTNEAGYENANLSEDGVDNFLKGEKNTR